MGKLHTMHKVCVNYLVPHAPSMETHAYKPSTYEADETNIIFVQIRNTRPEGNKEWNAI